MSATAVSCPDHAAIASEDVCAVCGREVGVTAFCHIYRDGRTITLCDPTCAEIFLHRSDAEPLAPPPWASVYECAVAD